jgi:response regulator RpfG family c-di-GMP phosphodiesterase
MAGPRQPTAPTQVPRILDRLLSEKRITREQHEALAQELRRGKHSVDEAMMDVLNMSEPDVLKALAAVYKTRFVSTEKLSKAQIDRALVDMLPRKTAERYSVAPILYDTQNATLSVVIADPDNVQALEEVKLVARVRQVTAFVARAAAVSALVRKVYHGEAIAFAGLERQTGQQQWPGGIDVFERQQAAAVASNEGLGAAQLKKLAHGGPQHHPGAISIELDDSALPVPQQHAPAPQARKPPSFMPPGGVPSLELPQVQQPPPPPFVQQHGTQQPPHGAPSERPPPGATMQQWLETLNVLVSLLENNRPDLRGHSSQTARLSRKFCERLGLAERDADEIVAAAYLHDLGKASSYHLTALNVSEYEGHKVAAEKSYLTPSRLMAGVKLPDATVRALNHMYERFDGKGFPDAMSGKEIPLGARVIAITDTYADLTQNPRNPYRKALKPVEASDVLAKYKGAIFDNNLVDIFRHVVTGDDLKAKLLANRGSALIIDPDPEETVVLELRMIEQGFEVKIARTSEQAMKALSEGEFELVISEVELQPIDGFALFERAQQIDGVRNATWVFLSGNTDREAIDKGFALGATDYVEKPVKAEILVAKLRKIMEQASASRTAARGVSGSLEEMGFPELVQILAQGRKTGALKIRSGGDMGELHFVGGDIYQANWGRARGEDAFYAMCRLRTGEFSLDPNFKAEQRAIQVSAEGMLLEGMRRMDEESRAG